MKRFASRLVRLARRNWYLIFFGMILQAIAIEYAFYERGYVAIGSEVIVLPIFWLAAWYTRELIKKLED